LSSSLFLFLLWPFLLLDFLYQEQSRMRDLLYCIISYRVTSSRLKVPDTAGLLLRCGSFEFFNSKLIDVSAVCEVCDWADHQFVTREFRKRNNKNRSEPVLFPLYCTQYSKLLLYSRDSHLSALSSFHGFSSIQFSYCTHK
jgi:hypothetical protein